MGIAAGKRTSLFSPHPSLDDRIEALRNLPPA
jgi:Zn-dependent protease with chaperone function